ncbi:hypothetical protein [Penaeicola halotolerans]|uniref:hypothetical protein n=1 Tax=Penaeicola halotolerans TaxID=2793196 RepID=UPI001CF82A18|nr:hypothetical protein [Penaeicola halotolerans]
MDYTKIILIALIFSALCLSSAICQNTSKREAVYLEGLGAGIFYSFNYDLRLKDQINGLGGKVGLSYSALDGARIATIPIAANLLIGKRKGFLELGLGATVIVISQNLSTNTYSFPRRIDRGIQFSGILGYRRVSDSGFLWRAGFTPFFTSDRVDLFTPQVSVGYAFQR